MPLLNLIGGGYLHSETKWRELKAEEYPEDDRNLRASDALTAVADEVAALPDNDPRLPRMDHALWFMDGLCHPGEQGREVARRYGFYSRRPRRLDTYGHMFPDEDEATRTAIETVLVARADSPRTTEVIV